jgi:subtilisin family serine protease
MSKRLSISVLLKITLIAALIIGGFVFYPSATAVSGEIDKNFGDHLKSLSPDEFVSAIVILSDQADISTLSKELTLEKATRKERHRQVISALREAADRSKGDITNYLNSKKRDGAVRGYTHFWIMNLVVIEAKRSEIENIAARSDVQWIEPNFQASLIKPVGKIDPNESSKGIGVTPGLRAINANRVWHELGYTGLGRVLSNIDTGVDKVHPALTNRWRGNHEPWRECWRDCLGYGDTIPQDYYGHGTHVMGTLTGLGASTADTIGVAWQAEWIADNAINQNVGTAFNNDILDAFQWIADPDSNPATVDDVPDVCQNSWGIYSGFSGYSDCDNRWQTVIVNCEAAGVVVTFSAGNEGPSAQTQRSPANNCTTPVTNFSIGAVNATNYNFPYPIADFSSRGPSDCDITKKKPEVVAPGVTVYSSVPGGSYQQNGWDGTSMAGPHVAGVVALMRQANPDLEVDSIKYILLNTARDLGAFGDDNNYGHGVIDAYAAVLAVVNGLYMAGDANRDSLVDVGDVIFLLNYLYESGPAPTPKAAGDVNADCLVEVGDVIYLINYLYKSGPAPVKGCA